MYSMCNNTITNMQWYRIIATQQAIHTLHAGCAACSTSAAVHWYMPLTALLDLISQTIT